MGNLRVIYWVIYNEKMKSIELTPLVFKVKILNVIQTRRGMGSRSLLLCSFLTGSLLCHRSRDSPFQPSVHPGSHLKDCYFQDFEILGHEYVLVEINSLWKIQGVHPVYLPSRSTWRSKVKVRKIMKYLIYYSTYRFAMYYGHIGKWDQGIH